MKCILAFAMLCLVGCTSVSKKSSATASAAQERHVTPFFYRAVRGDQTIWLLGTAHRWVRLGEIPTFVLERLQQSQVFASEFDPSRIGEVQRYVEEKRRSKPLKNYFTETEIETLAKKVAARSGDQDLVTLTTILSFESATNVFAYIHSSPALGGLLTASKSESLDNDLRALAAKSGMSLAYLDNPVLAGNSYLCLKPSDEQYVRFLRAEMNSQAQDVKQLRTSENEESAYRSGDSNRIRKLFDDYPKDLRSCLLDNRNAAWVSSILQLARVYPNVFVAVGVGHLESGGRSLLSELQEDGFSVTRIDDGVQFSKE